MKILIITWLVLICVSCSTNSSIVEFSSDVVVYPVEPHVEPLPPGDDIKHIK